MAKHEDIIRQLSSLAHRMFADGRGEVFLYGSRANGNAKPYSDWDVLIVTDDGLSTSDDFEAFALPFAELGWRCGEQITPLHYTQTQWAAESSTAFYHNVVSTRIRL